MSCRDQPGKLADRDRTQLEADAIKLSDPAKHRYGIYIPLGSSEWISYEWEALLWANGGQFMNSDNTKVAFDSPAMQSCAQ